MTEHSLTSCVSQSGNSLHPSPFVVFTAQGSLPTFVKSMVCPSLAPNPGSHGYRTASRAERSPQTANESARRQQARQLPAEKNKCQTRVGVGGKGG